MYRFRKDERERLEAARLYVAEHLHEPLRVTALSTLAAMNRHKLNAGFALFYGNPVRRYILALRLEKAREMLQEGSRDLQTIAEETGFGYAANLSRLYKRQYGRTPGQDRGAG